MDGTQYADIAMMYEKPSEISRASIVYFNGLNANAIIDPTTVYAEIDHSSTGRFCIPSTETRPA